MVLNEKLNEKKLVRQFQQGSAQAFDTLYGFYGERIYRFCYRLCGRSADAEDLTQEVFVAAFQGMARFEGRSGLATWLYRIALYQWRHRQSGPPACDLLDEETAQGLRGADMEKASVDNIVLGQALAALPPALYEAFLLVKMEGLTYREAAAALNTPQGTLQYRVHEAVMRLRALLQTNEDEGKQAKEQKRQAIDANAETLRPEHADFQEQTSHAV